MSIFDAIGSCLLNTNPSILGSTEILINSLGLLILDAYLDNDLTEEGFTFLLSCCKSKVNSFAFALILSYKFVISTEFSTIKTLSFCNSSTISKILENPVNSPEFIEIYNSFCSFLTFIENDFNKKELMEFRLGYSEKGYVDFCRQCDGYFNNPYHVMPAEQMDNKCKEGV